MLVLVTGASGFVGSHVVESLLKRGILTAVLLRPTSRRDFIKHVLHQLEVRIGALDDPESLIQALYGVTHVIHCAGLTKACSPEEFINTNHVGTRNLVSAVNKYSNQVCRFVLVSSLAAVGPSAPGKPVDESVPPHPVSVYGWSKLLAEREVIENSQVEYTILRPPAVYGPRDDGFLSMFRLIGFRLVPRFIGGIKEMSFVYVRDLAEVIAEAVVHPLAGGKTYFVSAREVVSPSEFSALIAGAMQVSVVPMPIPVWVMWPVCAVSELVARVRKKPTILNRQKFAEFKARAWTCDPSRLESELAVACRTPLKEGINETVRWYQENGWL